MLKRLMSFLSFGTLIASGIALPPSHGGSLESRAASGNYSLFAYGTNTDTEIGGFPIVYYHGSSCPPDHKRWVSTYKSS